MPDPQHEPLRAFLLDSLSDTPIELDEGEIISDAIVIFRVSSISEESANGFGERYRYTVTPGVNLSMAFGMMQITRDTLADYYHRWLDDGDDD